MTCLPLIRVLLVLFSRTLPLVRLLLIAIGSCKSCCYYPFSSSLFFLPYLQCYSALCGLNLATNLQNLAEAMNQGAGKGTSCMGIHGVDTVDDRNPA